MATPILIIDAGHGGADSGAVGNGLLEKDLTLKITNYQLKRFKELNVPVVATRTNDITLDPNKRTTIVRNSGAAHCISNHINAGGGDGAEIIRSYFDSNLGFPTYAMNELRQHIKFRKIYDRVGNGGLDYYYMHRQTGNVKTYIIEHGFIDNASDAAFLRDHWDRLAESVVKAYCQFINVSYVPPGTPPTQQPPTKPNTTDYPPNYPDYKKNGVVFLFDHGFLTDASWKSKAENPLPLWSLGIVLQRMFEELKK